MISSSDLTHGDVTRILQIIDKLSDVEVLLEIEGMKLHVRKYSTAAAGQATEPASMMLAGDSAMGSTRTLQDAALPARAAEPIPVESTAAKVNESNQSLMNFDAGISGSAAVRSPVLGRFFRASAPTEAPYVEVGSKVQPDDTVCVIEVMKLFSTVRAGLRGTIVHIAVENGAMVEHDAVLFMVKPE